MINDHFLSKVYVSNLFLGDLFNCKATSIFKALNSGN
jgi:hypothetical protein